MFKNYLTVAIRNLLRHKVYSFVNIFGLAIGIAFCILTFLFVRNEWTYDTFHENADRIYRVYTESKAPDGKIYRMASVPPALGPSLVAECPEVIQMTRLIAARSSKVEDSEVQVTCGGNTSQEEFLLVDRAFFDLFSFPLKSGDPETALNERNSVVLSEAMTRRYFGDQDPIGKRMSIRSVCDSRQVEDFVVTGVIAGSYPALVLSRFRASEILKADDIPGTLAYMKEKWNEVTSEFVFRYSFWDEDIERFYRDEERWGKIITYSALFALFIAAIGAFGLTSLAVTRRTKEIGIRKVLGAPVFSIVSLLSKDLVNLVIMANIVAWPIAYYAMDRWLQDFAYRTDLGADAFLLGGVLTLATVLLTVVSLAVKAALANPVDALRYE